MPLPISDGDHCASTAAVDAASLYSATFLLAMRQIVRSVQFVLLHCNLSPWLLYLLAVRTGWRGERTAALRDAEPLGKGASRDRSEPTMQSIGE